MIYALIWAPAFVVALKALPTADAVAVANNVLTLARDPRPRSRTVSDFGDDRYVLRVGNCDVLYEVTGLTIRALLVTTRNP